MKDLYSNIGIVHLLDASNIGATDAKSSILDLNGFDSAVMSVNVGAIGALSDEIYLTPVLQESDTTVDGDFTTVAAADLIGAFTKIDAAAKDQVTQRVGYIGTKRYIRLLLDVTGNTVSCYVSVDGIVSRADDSPVTAPAAVTAT